MKNRGIPAVDIARGVHHSVVNRLAAMLERLGYEEEIVFSGGVARNPCIGHMLRERLGGRTRIISPPAPDLVGAVGAALYGSR